MARFQGICECGGVKFSVTKMRDTVTVCHCGQCRRMSGHYLALTRANLSDMAFSSDKTLSWYRSSKSAQRGFCSCCGTTLFFQPIGADHMGIAAGCLNAPTEMTVGKHIFVDDKGDYYPMPSDAPLFDGYDTPRTTGD